MSSEYAGVSDWKNTSKPKMFYVKRKKKHYLNELKGHLCTYYTGLPIENLF